MFVFLRKSVVRALLPALLISAFLFPPAGPHGPLLLLPIARAAALPELPRVYIDTTYTAPSGPTTNVPAGGDFQAALNTAQPGSTIVLQAGATYTGNFVLPNKSSGWIYVRSSALASLPASGNRVFPSQAGLMPKLVDANGGPTIRTAGGAHHFRLVGLEITTTWATTSGEVNTVVDLGGSNNIIIDRSYVHGTPTGNIKQGLALNGSSLAVVDSYLSDFHHVTYDSQAIAGWNGSGPFKIVNNYLEGAGENVMFGGADPTTSGLVPADIEIRGNHFMKPLTWRAGDPSYAGIRWIVKNLFELKNARRVLVEGNVFEQNWGGDQHGFAILFTPRNQNGACTWCVVEDVTLTSNIIRRATAGVSVFGWDDLQQSQQARRILIRNNLFTDIGIWPSYDAYWTGTLFWIKDGTADVTIDHNTALQAGNIIVGSAAGGKTHIGFVFTNNITPHSNYGVTGPGTGTALQTLNTFFPGWTFARDVVAGGTGSAYPADNFFPASTSLVGFLDLAAGNFRLGPASPYRYLGLDGKDPGADIDALAAATANAITGAGPVLADTTPPAVALTDPLPNTSVSGTVTVSANAIDNVGVAGVQFKLNGSNLGAEDTINAYSVLWDSTKVGNGSYTFTAVARDAAGNTSTSAPVTVTVNNPDTTPPIISSVTVPTVTPAGASISWTTNEPADTQVEYGLTTSYGGATSVNPSMVTAHAVTLSSLAASTTYHYRVKSKDAASNLALSSDLTFTTAPAPDTLPPSTPTGLSAAAVSTSRIDLTWSAAADNVGVDGYKIFRDGVQVATVSSNPYQNTGLSAATTYTYTVAAFDTAGNTSAQSSPVSATTLAIVQAPYKGTPRMVPGQIEAEDFDDGGEGVAYHDAVPGNAGGAYRTDVDIDIFRLSNGAHVVRNFQTGEWQEYTISVNQAGTYRLDLLVSSGFTTSRWSAAIDGVPVTGSVAVPHTGSWSIYQWVGVNDIPLTAGQHVLRITADQEYFDFAALRIAKGGRSPFKDTPIAVPGEIEAEDFDWGGEGVAYHDAVPGNAGGQHRPTEDVDIFTVNGANVVRNFQTGEWLEYTINVTQAGTYRLELLVSSASFVISRWHAEVDGTPVTGSVPVPNAGWNTFQWVGVDGISLTAGTHVLRITADQEYFDFAALRISSQ